MKKFFLIILTAILVLSAAAKTKKGGNAVRSSDKVRKEQQDTRRKIKRTQGEINENTAKTREGLRQLGEIEADIAVRQQAIDRTGERIAELNSRIALLTDSAEMLENNIALLKNDYAESLRAMRRQRQTLNTISYLFSAESFAQAFRRVRYLNELGDWRHSKTLRLGKAVDELNTRKAEIDSARQRLADEQAALLSARSQLDKRRGEAATLVGELRKQGRTLNAELRRQQQQLNELNRELDRAVAEEVRRAEEERRRKAAEEEARRRAEEERRRKQQESEQKAAPTDGSSDKQPAEKTTDAQKSGHPKPAPSGEIGFAEKERRLTGDFEANKGRLLFPVAGKYTITGAYGRHTRPGTNVAVDNRGIDISVDAGTGVRAVFGGEVVSVFKVKGTGFYAILVRPGTDISVNSKLGSYSGRTGLH
ncbi:MAG: hypothetical protein K2H03_01835, partial [Muribaculaceae bacterium]|nr:hypothetical protein [Muribaculaceae bacterium]